MLNLIMAIKRSIDNMFNLSDIVVSKGIITTYSIASLFSNDNEIRKANEDEIKRYKQW